MRKWVKSKINFFQACLYLNLAPRLSVALCTWPGPWHTLSSERLPPFLLSHDGMILVCPRMWLATWWTNQNKVLLMPAWILSRAEQKQLKNSALLVCYILLALRAGSFTKRHITNALSILFIKSGIYLCVVMTFTGSSWGCDWRLLTVWFRAKNTVQWIHGRGRVNRNPRCRGDRGPWGVNNWTNLKGHNKKREEKSWLRKQVPELENQYFLLKYLT